MKDNCNRIPAICSYLFFVFSIVLLNPWGNSQAEIWTVPKTLALQAIVVLNLWVIFKSNDKILLKSPAWKLGFGLWLIFLGIGLVSTVLSPFPSRSIWGQSVMGDGLIYWEFLAAFVLTNALLLTLEPRLFKYQLYGIITGGIILALSIFPQILDWRIDYTATSGQINQFNPEMLESTIWKSKMPIGLYSNRGHAAFPLAAIAVLILLALLKNCLSPILAKFSYFLLCNSLFYTQCRGAYLALFLAIAYLFLRYCYKLKQKKIILQYGIGLLLLSYLLFKISINFLTIDLIERPPPTNLEQFSTGRLHLWGLALKGIYQRPLIGWGFDGFGIAFPFIGDWHEQHRGYLIDKVAVSEIIQLNDLSFSYLGIDQKLHTAFLITNKAHNIFLDTAISVGILGLLVYLTMFVFWLYCTYKSRFQGIETIAITYLIYTLTWFESAQFSHLGWWALSVGLASTSFLSNSSQPFQGQKGK